jgi:hypothetical protein
MSERPWTWHRRRVVAALAGLPFTATAAAVKDAPRLWHSEFRAGLADWGPLADAWGTDNHRFLADPEVAGQALRIRIRKGSIDPASMLRRQQPRSGTGFKARVIAGGSDGATLHYRLRFASDFDFVRGGKLPGLFGGRGNSGGAIPSGDDGFSTRLMWRERGEGEVYAYLPGSRGHGSSLLRGRLVFEPGRWHSVAQELLLNTPGHRDGSLRLWLDGQPVGETLGLHLRDGAALRIDGVFVDVFFGGNDDSWAARADTHIELAEFEIHSALRPSGR